MGRRIRDIVRIEDLLWAAVTAVVGGTGLELLGGTASPVLLGGAALAFWAAALSTSREDPAPRDRRVLLLGLVPPVILIDAALAVQDDDRAPRVALTLAAVALGGVAALQHWRTGGRTWLRLPRRARRVLAWPYLMAAGDLAGGLIDRQLDPRHVSSLHGATAAETGFRIALILGAVFPLCFAAFVAAPRAIAADDRAPLGTWAYRYAVAVVGAAAAGLGAINR